MQPSRGFGLPPVRSLALSETPKLLCQEEIANRLDSADGLVIRRIRLHRGFCADWAAVYGRIGWAKIVGCQFGLIHSWEISTLDAVSDVNWMERLPSS